MRCPGCKKENPDAQNFCGHCGAALAETCPACKTVNPAGRTSCGSCGNPLAARGAVAAVEPYTPSALRTGPLASRFASEGEHKQVTVLFCDIVDSTRHAARLGAESWHGVLNDFFERALGEIHGHGGTINQFLGDGFMALFGAPIAHEDHAKRAAHAALGLVSGFESRPLPTFDGPLELRIGMNTGSVVVGEIGDNLRMDYTAVGDTTNLAARMESAAAPGEIRMTGKTWHAVSQFFEGDSLGPQRVKGKSDPVEVYRLTAIRQDARTDMGRFSPLTGRDRELGVLLACLDDLVRGTGGVASVIGDAGVGKSRLLLELHNRSGGRVDWLRGHALSFGQTLSYGPFIEILRAAAGINDADSVNACWNRVRMLITELLGADAELTIPFAGLLTGLELPDDKIDPVRHLDAADVRAQLYRAARNIFGALAKRRPLVLELDDWHWADEASAILLEHLLPLTKNHPLLICVAGRAQAAALPSRLREQAQVEDVGRHTELLLTPLSPDDANGLLEGLLGTRDASPRLRKLILERGDGNPLFLEEIVQALRATGLLKRDAGSGRLYLAGDVGGVVLPDTIEGIVSARIDRLEEDVRHVLKLAAVIGRNFHRRILLALDEAEQQLDACLGELETVELIREKRHIPEIEYMFKHAVVQEAAYSTLLGARRRSLHQQVGAAMERLFADRLDEFASFLAYHYARAEDWPNAQRFMIRAGDLASRMAADHEAVDHYRDTLEILARTTGASFPRGDRAALECKLGEALFRLGQHEEAVEYLYRALALLDIDFPRARSAVRAKLVRRIIGRLWYYLSGGHRRATRKHAPPADPILVRTIESLAWTDFFVDQERFILDIIVGLDIAERAGPAPAVAEGYMGLGIACDVLGFSKLAAFHHRHAKQIADMLDDRHASASADFGAGMHAYYAGEWDLAGSKLQNATAIWRDQKRVREWGLCALTLTALLRTRARLGDVMPILNEVQNTGSDCRDIQIETGARFYLALVDMERGGLDAASAAIDKALAHQQAFADLTGRPEFLAGRAWCSLWQGHDAIAESAIAEANEICKRIHVPADLQVMLRIVEGRLLIRELVRPGVRPASRAGHELKRPVAALRRLARSFAGARPAAFYLRATYDWYRGAQRSARESWASAVVAADKLGSTYYRGLALSNQGQLSSDTKALLAAVTAFEEIGAHLECAQAYRYLHAISRRENGSQTSEYAARAFALHDSMNAPDERALLDAQVIG